MPTGVLVCDGDVCWRLSILEDGLQLLYVQWWATLCGSSLKGAATCGTGPHGASQSGTQRPRTQTVAAALLRCSAHARGERPSHSGEMCVSCQRLVRGESGDRPTVGNQRRMSIAFPHMPAARQPPPAHGEISNEQGRLAQAPPKAPRWSVTALGRIVWDPVGIPAAAMQARAPSCASAPSWAGACPMAVDARRLVTCDLNVWINGSAVLLVLVESPAFTLHHKS